MPDLFFYGTLQHVPLLELVLGRKAEDLQLSRVELADHSVYAVQDQIFPMIQAEPGGTAHGLLAQGLSDNDVARLAFYEGGFEYDLQRRTVTRADGTTATAQVFFPAPGTWQPGGPWSLGDWVDNWGPVTLLAAEEEMAYFGRVEAATIARYAPATLMRAWAKLAAQARKTGDSRDVAEDVIVHRRNRAYFDYFGVDEIELQHRKYDGTMGPVLKRSALMQGSAVIILPYDPLRDSVLLVEQFRAPPFLIGDPEPWIWETVAGMIDPGETPEQAAHRECMEEAGLTLNALHYAGGAYSSTGSSTEFVHLYIGLADLTETISGGGLDTEGEDIRSRILPFDTFKQMLDSHGFKNLQLLAAAHWLIRNRDRLRGS
ncbi:NUDIX domain-containing protein [Ruegeria sp.]|uniref:NUDIX domain-containing protein n=1 Tax=Ruegeria sp. TaxID=1879320 RepID=UPI002310B94B|nr:NUDIX domain-containing protein [Ruegeria sp.]MDA7965267.1 NUDIX domain-containing protein [Ruegeria sp.]